jgi:hypothetical protein
VGPAATRILLVDPKKDIKFNRLMNFKWPLVGATTDNWKTHACNYPA